VVSGTLAPHDDSRGATLGTATSHWSGVYLAPCTSATSPAACDAAVTGFVNIAPSQTTITIATTAVTMNSTISVQFDESLGSSLGVTCNNAAASEGATYFISARMPGKSFSIKTNNAPTQYPACLSFTIIN
jgi:hypothetical protein